MVYDVPDGAFGVGAFTPTLAEPPAMAIALETSSSSGPGCAYSRPPRTMR